MKPKNTLILLAILSPIILFCEIILISDFMSSLTKASDISVFFGVVEIVIWLLINYLLYLLIKTQINKL